MKKILLVFILSFGIFGCNNPKPVEPVSLIPNFIVLENEDGGILGRGFVISDTIGAAPDHLFELGNALFWKGEKLKILVRDFENDIVLFGFEGAKTQVVGLSDTPPAIGNRLYWFGGKKNTVEVQGIGVSFEAEGKLKKNLIVLSGMIETGMSGAMLFDDTGMVWGMIIGADRSQNQIYAVRADSILNLLEEQG